jgi:hypothetical protein
MNGKAKVATLSGNCFAGRTALPERACRKNHYAFVGREAAS